MKALVGRGSTGRGWWAGLSAALGLTVWGKGTVVAVGGGGDVAGVAFVAAAGAAVAGAAAAAAVVAGVWIGPIVSAAQGEQLLLGWGGRVVGAGSWAVWGASNCCPVGCASR